MQVGLTDLDRGHALPAPAMLPIRPPLRPLMVGGLILGGGWIVGDLGHGPLGSLGLAALAGAGVWMLQRPKPAAVAALPQAPEPLLEHCRSLLQQFEALGLGRDRPDQQLRQLQQALDRPEEQLVLAGRAPADDERQWLQQGLRRSVPALLHMARPLPSAPERWCWPAELLQADRVVWLLGETASAADLRWLQAAPQDLPVLVLAACPDPARWPALRHELAVQLGDGPTLARLGDPLPAERLPFAGRRRATRLRCLRQLQDGWQQQLEAERRRRLQPLVQRSQWLVAAAVLASPLPSTDLLLTTAVNGLLLREMAEIWPCRWTPEQLRSAALELGRVALALGTVEWGGQALAAALRLHGATWLVGGTLQALSAAYLTRVLARSMADALALASGVPDDELPALQTRFPQLVSRALEQERLDWQGFVDQALAWGQRQTAPTATPMATPRITPAT
jgi:uncharacterized protein (DUF697 family)